MSSSANSRRTAFLDRDGTINVKAPEGRYVRSWQEFRFLPGAVEAIALLREAGWTVVVVTNQRGIALGCMSRADVDEIHRRMRLAAPVDAVYVCPHERESCACRKPGVGMFLAAARDMPQVAFERSVTIGDSKSDMLAARRIGSRPMLIGRPPWPSLLDAVRDLLGGETMGSDPFLSSS